MKVAVGLNEAKMLNTIIRYYLPDGRLTAWVERKEGRKGGPST